MTVKELKELLKGIPDNAEVIIETEYANHPEGVEYSTVTRSELADEFCCEGIENAIYEWDNWREVYDEDAVFAYPIDGKVTGVLLSSVP